MFNLFSKLAAAVSTTIPETVAEETTKVIEETTQAALKFSTENLSDSLIKSVAGMVGIFVVIGVIILSVSLLNKFGSDKKKD